MTGFKIGSFNVKGLNNRLKRKQLFMWLRKKAFSIYFLQETHSENKTENIWHNEWGFTSYFCHDRSNSAGVAVLFNNNFEFTIKKYFLSDNGRFIILDVEINNIIYTLINIYAFNDDRPELFDLIIEHLSDFESENIIFGGDFNCVRNINLDKRGGRPCTNFKMQQKVSTLVSSFNLIDIWRENNADEFNYTWKSNHSPPILCRLDYFLISEHLWGSTVDCDIIPGFRSDHSFISIHIDHLKEKRGSGFWKMNTSLLFDETYRTMIRNSIQNIVDLNNNANPDILWEVIKNEIRGQTIKYASKKSKENKRRENILEKEIVNLNMSFTQNPTDINKEKLLSKQQELERIYEERAKGAIIRSRARWTELGEKNTKYFLNLEKRNHVNKCISKLQLDDDTIITNSNDILKEEVRFYSQLYTSATTDDSDFCNYLPEVADNCLSQEEAQLCEGKITIDECVVALKTMSNNKTPGCDGIPVEFYKLFWNDIKPYLINSFNFSLVSGNMSVDQRRGVITLIPKQGKNPNQLKNWRPISLLNVDYKLCAKVLANRIKNVLPKLIDSDQTGFMKNRYIGENIRLVLDTIRYTGKKDIPGVLMFLDYEKAFDRLEWSFVNKALEYFKFGPQYINWISTLYNNISSCIINNGHVSTFFEVSRGVRQGCPLSPYLFILAAELMAIAIRMSDDITGIKINDLEVKISAYADDTTLFLDGSEKSVLSTFKILDSFCMASGMKINFDKSEAMKLGPLRDDFNVKPIGRGLSWSNGPVRLLGILLTHNEADLFDLNYIPQLEKIKNLLKIWSRRDLTPIGKITIVKSLALSQLTFLLTVLPNPSREFIKQVNKVIYHFVWNGKPDKVARKIIINDYEHGGLKMPDLEHFQKGLKCAWVKRYINGKDNVKWKVFFDVSLLNCGLKDFIWDISANVTDFPFHVLENSFLADVLKAWLEFKSCSINNIDIASEILWYNSQIKVKKHCVFYKTWSRKGVLRIRDLISPNRSFLSYDEFTNKFHVNCSFIQYYGLLNVLPKSWRHQIGTLNLDGHNNNNNDFVTNFCSLEKTSKLVYQTIIEQVAEEPTKCYVKWIDIFDQDLNWCQIHQNAFSISQNPKLQYFQFKFIHFLIPTNTFLAKIGQKESNSCLFCEIYPEKLLHLFWECEKVKHFWKEIAKWLNEKLQPRDQICFSARLICFGKLDEPKCLTSIIAILGKKFIFNQKCQENKCLNITAFINFVKDQYTSEKCSAVKNSKMKDFTKKWHDIFEEE